MSDFPFRLIALRDQPRYDLDGSVVAEKVAIFYLGKFGPFTETFPAATFTDDAFRARREALLSTLVNMHR